MISLWLRSGGSLKHVIHQLKDIGSSLQVATKEGKIMSLGDGLARALLKYQRAKSRFGLHDLLLGEVDFSELDRPPDHQPDPGDRTPAIPATGGTPGNGNGGGNGHRTAEVRHGGGPIAISSTPVADSVLAIGRSRTQGYKVKCNECGSPLSFAEGCVLCTNPACGYAAC